MDGFVFHRKENPPWLKAGLWWALRKNFQAWLNVGKHLLSFLFFHSVPSCFLAAQHLARCSWGTWGYVFHLLLCLDILPFPPGTAKPISSPAGGDGADRDHSHPGQRRKDQRPGKAHLEKLPIPVATQLPPSRGTPWAVFHLESKLLLQRSPAFLLWEVSRQAGLQLP